MPKEPVEPVHTDPHMIDAIESHKARLEADPHAAFLPPHLEHQPTDENGEALKGHPIIATDHIANVTVSFNPQVYVHDQCGGVTRWPAVDWTEPSLYCANCLGHFPTEQFAQQAI